MQIKNNKFYLFKIQYRIILLISHYLIVLKNVNKLYFPFVYISERYILNKIILIYYSEIP